MRKISAKFLESEIKIYQRIKERDIEFLKFIKQENIEEFTLKDLMKKTKKKQPLLTNILTELYITLILDKEEKIIISEKNNKKYFVDKYKINLFTKKIFEVLE